MATNTRAYFLFPPGTGEVGSAGAVVQAGQALAPEGAPAVLWGQGTPDGDRSPFLNVNKGSLYAQVNATDDETSVWMKVDEGEDDADWVRLLAEVMGLDHGAASGEDASIDWDIAAEMAASVYYAGLDLRVVLTGTSAVWASAAYFKITAPSATKAVNGYVSGVEIELVNENVNPSALFPLVLNFSDNGSNSQAQRAFMALRDYGSETAVDAFLWLGQEIVAAVGTSANDTLFTTTAGGYEADVDYALRIIAGNANTPYWIPLCSTGPGG